MWMTQSKSLRADVLGDAQVLASIRNVLRRRGVPEHELDDMCREVVAEAWAAKGFPEHSPDEARKYTYGIAARVAFDHRRKKNPLGAAAVPYDESESALESAAVPHEARDAAARLLGQGKALFPRTFPWLVQHAVAGEEAAAIAAREGVTAGHVRHEVSQIRRTLRIAAIALGVVVTLVLLFVGRRSLRNAFPFPGPAPEIAKPDWAPPMTPSQNEAYALRIEAKRDCDTEDWPACADRLEKAHDLDPAGETDEIRQLREQAAEKAKPPEEEPPRSIGQKEPPRPIGPKEPPRPKSK